MKRFKKNYPKTARFIKHAGSAIQVASKAYTLAKTVAALVNSERMIYQIVPTGFTVSTTPTIFNLTPMVQGDGVGNRHGNVVAIESINFKDQIFWNTAGSPTQQIRRMIIIDRNEELAEWNTPNELLSAISMVGQKSITTRARFKVLSDKIMTYDTSKDAMVRKMYLKNPGGYRGKQGQILRHHVVYNGNNTFGRGCIYVMYFSTVAANLPTVSMQYETKYYDN